MPRRKRTASAATPERSAAGTALIEPLTNKMEGVRRALTALSRGAKPKEIQRYLSDNFGLDMTTKAISSYKNILLKKGFGRRKPGRKPKSATTPAVAANGQGTPRRGASGSMTFEDIQTVKALVKRLGVDNVRALAQLLGG